MSEWERGRVLRELKFRFSRRSSYGVFHNYRLSKKRTKPLPRMRRGLSNNYIRLMMR